jgi:hypothetical protein
VTAIAVIPFGEWFPSDRPVESAAPEWFLRGRGEQLPDADAGCHVIATDVRRLMLQGVVLALDSGRNGDACDRASMSSTCQRCREAAHLLGPCGGTREAPLADGNGLPSVEGGDGHQVLLLHCGHRPPGPGRE